jgi:hypothetical protein
MRPDPLKATVISLFPMPISEFKPGLYPGYFTMPAAPLGDFTYLVVGDALFYTENKNEQVLTVRTPFHILAESIVHDFQENHIGRIVGDWETGAEPGLFFVPGGYESKNDIRKEHDELISYREEMQNRWFGELVKIADDSFQRTNRTSAVSQLQRLAARRLNIQRPWSLDITGQDKCPFCKQGLPYGAVKCPTCREIVNQAAYKALLEGEADSVTTRG